MREITDFKEIERLYEDNDVIIGVDIQEKTFLPIAKFVRISSGEEMGFAVLSFAEAQNTLDDMIETTKRNIQDETSNS